MTQPRKSATVGRSAVSGGAGGRAVLAMATDRLAVPAPPRAAAAGRQHPHAEPDPSRPRHQRGQSGRPKRAGRGEQRPPERLVTEHAKHRPGERRQSPLLEQPLPRHLQPAPIRDPGGAHRLAAPAAEAGVEVLHQRVVVRSRSRSAPARASARCGRGGCRPRRRSRDRWDRRGGRIRSGRRGRAGRRTPSRRRTDPFSPPSSATLSECPGSKLSRRRPTSWPTPSR